MGPRAPVVAGSRETDGERFIADLGVAMPEAGWFDRAGDLTALRVAADGRPYRSNYLRGRLLYALVAARRPALVLELGTGRGFGTLCAARAMADAGIDGEVRTVDLVPPDREIEWTYRDERGARTERWTRAAFWREHFPAEWVDRVVQLTGTSVRVMDAWIRRGAPRADLAFVDGGHDQATARHDVLASMAVASERFGMLLDDVADRPGFGVADVVRELLAGRFPVILVPTEWGGGPLPGAGMAWVDTVGADAERRELAALRRKRGFPWPWR